MLNLQKNSFTKLISLVLIQAFLCPGIGYTADCIRKPMGDEIARMKEASERYGLVVEMIENAIRKRLEDPNIPEINKTLIAEELGLDKSYIAGIIKENPILDKLYTDSRLTKIEAKILRAVKENPNIVLTPGVLRMLGISPSSVHRRLNMDNFDPRAGIVIESSLKKKIRTRIKEAIIRRLKDPRVPPVTKALIAEDIGANKSTVGRVIAKNPALNKLYERAHLVNSEAVILRAIRSSNRRMVLTSTQLRALGIDKSGFYRRLRRHQISPRAWPVIEVRLSKILAERIEITMRQRVMRTNL